MTARILDGFDHREFYLEVLAKSETSRRMFRVAAAMAQRRGSVPDG